MFTSIEHDSKLNLNDNEEKILFHKKLTSVSETDVLTHTPITIKEAIISSLKIKPNEKLKSSVCWFFLSH